MKILIVEDSPVIRAAYRGYLSKYFAQVDMAEDGMKALNMANNRYDVILTDIYLPHINGIDLTAKIRKEKKAGNPVIIGITSDDNPERHQMCLAAGMNAVLQKPVGSKEILRTIEKFTQKIQVVKS